MPFYFALNLKFCATRTCAFSLSNLLFQPRRPLYARGVSLFIGGILLSVKFQERDIYLGVGFEYYLSSFLANPPFNLSDIQRNEESEVEDLRKWDLRGKYSFHGIETVVSFEAKFDVMSGRTPNIAVQTHSHDIATGNYYLNGIQTTEADRWVHAMLDPDVFFVARPLDVYDMALELAHWHGPIGDSVRGLGKVKNSLGFLLKKTEVLEYVKDHFKVFEYDLADVMTWVDMLKIF